MSVFTMGIEIVIEKIIAVAVTHGKVIGDQIFDMCFNSQDIAKENITQYAVELVKGMDFVESSAWQIPVFFLSCIQKEFVITVYQIIISFLGQNGLRVPDFLRGDD